jgi:hypothetical protein
MPRIPVHGVRLAKAPEERVRVPDRVIGEQVIEVGVLEYLCHSGMGTSGLGTRDWGLGREPSVREEAFSAVIASLPSP